MFFVGAQKESKKAQAAADDIELDTRPKVKIGGRVVEAPCLLQPRFEVITLSPPEHAPPPSSALLLQGRAVRRSFSQMMANGELTNELLGLVLLLAMLLVYLKGTKVNDAFAREA